MKRYRRSRDGSAAQFQGKCAFRGWQTMKARHSLESEDKQKVSMHGKDVADGDGSAVSGMVKKVVPRRLWRRDTEFSSTSSWEILASKCGATDPILRI